MEREQDDAGIEDTYSEASLTSSTKRGKRTTSRVWSIFKKREIGPDGRQKAECTRCGAVLMADSISGTSGMSRHIANKCQNIDEQIGLYSVVDHDMY